MLHVLRFTVGCLFAAGLVVGCGGSGDGGDTTASLLSGPYHFVGIEAHTDTVGIVRTQWGAIASNGTGYLQSTTISNDDGTVGGLEMEGGIPYGISSQRALNVWDPTSPGQALASGRIAPSGDLGALGTTENGSDPGLYLALRRSGAFSTASLQGDYAVCVFLCNIAGHVNEGDAGEFTFDGVGGLSGGITYNVEGTVGGTPVSGSYTVDSTGHVSIGFGGPGTVRGGILENGDVAVAAGNTVSGENPMFLVLVRRTVGATNGLFAGQYYLAGIEHDIGADAYRAVTGTLVADADGAFTAETRENDEGVVSPVPSPASGTYIVSPNGHLRIESPGGVMEGSVAPGGGFAVIGGGTETGTNPSLFVLVR